MPFLIREIQVYIVCSVRVKRAIYVQAECDEQCGRIVEQLQAERLLDHKVRRTGRE